MKSRWVYTYKDGWRERSPRQPAERNSPYIISDEMPETLHPVNGKAYTSKSRYERAIKAHGYEPITMEENAREIERQSGPSEVVTEREVDQIVGESFGEIREGQANLSDFDREICKVIDRTMYNKV